MIHEGLDIPFRQTLQVSYHDTKLVGNLAIPGETFVVAIDEGNLKIRLCSIDKKGSDGATLSIGLDDVGCDSEPGAVSNPIGIQNMKPGVPVDGISAFRNEIIEFRMDIDMDVESVTCTASGESGDADLFINFGSSPQISFTAGVNAVSIYASKAC